MHVSHLIWLDSSFEWVDHENFIHFHQYWNRTPDLNIYTWFYTIQEAPIRSFPVFFLFIITSSTIQFPI